MNRAIFFKEYKKHLDANHRLDQKEVNAIDSFLDGFDKQRRDFSLKQWAYIFATTFHETNATFLPIKEAYWLSESWRKRNLRYSPFYGRGYVQITWRRNYKIFSKILGEDFVKNPDLVMVPKYAFKILTHGFKHGVFTGKKITDYINGNKANYIKARKCINGKDKAVLIANYAKAFENMLIKSGF